MIKKVDIKKFGQFNNYQWSTLVGKDQEFKKLNIIYGRNYSGKTTLSRIFRCIEKGELHQHYCDGDFQLIMDDNSSITQSNIGAYSSLIKMRVYNIDFVHENLSWLHNADGTITPFTVLGEINVEVDKKLKDISIELGSIESGVGVLFELEEAKKAMAQKRQEYEKKHKEIVDLLKNKADDIKRNTALFDVPVYNSLHIKRDLDVVSDEHVLTEEKKERCRKLLKEEPKKDLKRFSESKPRYEEAFMAVKELVEKEIRLSQPIQELLEDKLLQEWVHKGIEIHRHKREACGFCGSKLPQSLWDLLDAHFVKESEDLRRAIDFQIEDLKRSIQLIESFFYLRKEDFYIDFQQSFETLSVQWSEAAATYKSNINNLIAALLERLENIFIARPAPSMNDNSNEILEILRDCNALVEENNRRSQSLVEDQKSARASLRLSEVAEFYRTISYKNQLQHEETLGRELEDANNVVTSFESKQNQLLMQKRLFESNAQDESRGAELVNQYLSHFFGHKELRLAAIDEGAKMHFKVKRDNADANNLSEGECSLISFCYFIAKMQDELDSDPNRLYIYIDDPISSLDSNHTFFIYSLIESVIAKEKKYKQLFISTHSLDFLKYVKTLTDSKKAGYFLMQKRSKGLTTLINAPAYLKDYVTEFNYLFNEIHACAFITEQELSEKHVYGFANNMRKFLEAYLYFKYPNKESLDKKITRFFSCDPVIGNLMNRLVNEYSHLKEQFDRGIAPIDVPEIRTMAIAVMEKLKDTDPDQYSALCESVGIAPPVIPEVI